MKRLAPLFLLLAFLAPVARAADPMAADRAAAAPAAAPAAQAAQAAPKGMHFIYLVRHGMYDRDDKVDDRVGNGLNALGRDQARLTGERLAALPVRFDRLVSSTLLRAMNTADLMAVPMKMNVVRDSLLSECTPTSSRADYMANHTPEEIAECDAQVTTAFARYFVPTPAADTRTVLVCHGNVIRVLLARALGMDPKEWARFDAGNGGVTVVQVPATGAIRLAVLNDVSHIPLSQQTFSGRGGGWSAPK